MQHEVNQGQTNHEISNISHTLMGSKNVDNTDVLGALPVDLTPDFNRLRKDNCKTRQETLKFCDLVRLMLTICVYCLKASSAPCIHGLY